jgi:predicted enzyme related to lactoylglutathione lyase
MGNAVVHFEVTGRDGDKVQQFYAGLFDWEIDADNPMSYGIVNREANLDQGIGIGGGVSSTMEGGEPYATFYVSVDDVGSALQKAESLGGTRVMDPMQVPDGPEIAQFKDPDGNLIGLVKTQPVE